MQIALVVHDLHAYGGHALYTKVLAEALGQRHEVTVYANTCERSSDARWSYRHVPALRASALTCVLTFPIGLARFEKELARFDVLHSQGYCGGSPTLVTAHFCVAAFRRAARELTWINRITLRIQEAVERQFYESYKGSVITISRKIGADLTQHYGLSKPFHLIPHGVDTTRFSSANRPQCRDAVRYRHGISPDRMVALYVGDLTKAHRGLRYLSLARPDISILCVSRSSRYRWLAENVIFAPPTKRVEEYYAAADVFVFPTVYDAFGLVVLEAMASGLPVFCSDQAGVSELIMHERDGYVWPLESWVEEASKALNQRDRLRDTGVSAERTARKHSWERVVAAVEDLYAEALAATA